MSSTSSLALEAIRESGHLGKRQRQAFEALVAHGPMTAAEATAKMRTPGLWKRFAELERAGLVERAGERVCTVSGQVAMVWRVRGGGSPPVSATADSRPSPPGPAPQSRAAGRRMRAQLVELVEQAVEVVRRRNAEAEGDLFVRRAVDRVLDELLDEVARRRP